MIVCVACSDPGGPDAVIDAPFDLTAILDYCDVHAEGHIEHLAQMRNCGSSGGMDPVETMKRRGAEKAIVTGLSPGTLLRFRNYGTRVLRTENPSARQSLEALVKGELMEIAIDQFSMVSGQKNVIGRSLEVSHRVSSLALFAWLSFPSLSMILDASAMRFLAILAASK